MAVVLPIAWALGFAASARADGVAFPARDDGSVAVRAILARVGDPGADAGEYTPGGSLGTLRAEVPP